MVNSILLNRIKSYQPITSEDYVNALREVMQECILFALSKTDFFSRCAFCGGTALRIFYQLKRSSEDLDFALIKKDDSFSLKPYLEKIQKQLSLLSIKVDVTDNSKRIVQSAFIKNDTRLIFLDFNFSDEIIEKLPKNSVLKIKLEVDTNPPTGATYQSRYLLFPYPARINLFDIRSLFSGKLHAVLCRKWDNMVKGRDYFDYLYYLSNHVRINPTLLKNALVQTKFIKSNFTLTNENLIKLLVEQFNHTDFKQAKNDVARFVKDIETLDSWSKNLFIDVTEHYQFMDETK